MVLVWACKSASLDRLLIKVTSKKTCFRHECNWNTCFHSERSSNNASPRLLLHRSTCGLSIWVTARWLLTSKKRNILNRRATSHLSPVRRASCVFDSSNTTRGLLFQKWFYPLYLLGTPQDSFCLLFSAMFVSFWIFSKVRKIINYLPIHLKTCKVG
jgi:hypothetical protein